MLSCMISTADLRSSEGTLLAWDQRGFASKKNEPIVAPFLELPKAAAFGNARELILPRVEERNAATNSFAMSDNCFCA